jgi:hypothetical protein
MGEVNWYIASSEEENSAPASLIYSWKDSAPLWSIKSIRGNIFSLSPSPKLLLPA